MDDHPESPVAPRRKLFPTTYGKKGKKGAANKSRPFSDGENSEPTRSELIDFPLEGGADLEAEEDKVIVASGSGVKGSEGMNADEYTREGSGMVGIGMDNRRLGLKRRRSGKAGDNRGESSTMGAGKVSTSNGSKGSSTNHTAIKRRKTQTAPERKIRSRTQSPKPTDQEEEQDCIVVQPKDRHTSSITKPLNRDSSPSKTTTMNLTEDVFGPTLHLHPPTSSPGIGNPTDTDVVPRTPPRSDRDDEEDGPSTPKTPNTPPKDLSFILSAVSPSPRSKLKPKSRRMLTKSQSSGEIPFLEKERLERLMASPVKLAASASADSLDPSKTTPGRKLVFGSSLPESALLASISPSASASGLLNTPSKRQNLGRTQSMSESPSKNSQPSSGGPVRRTYGKSRSYLTETRDNGVSSPGATSISDSGEREGLNSTDALLLEQSLDLLGTPTNSGEEKPKESYAELRKKFATDDSMEGEDEEDHQGMEATRVANLRSKGENRRFMDELGYLMEGLNEVSLTLRRNCALDLLGKAMDGEWFAKLGVCGQVDTLYRGILEAGREEINDTSNLISLLYLALVAKTPGRLEACVAGNLNESIGLLVEIVARNTLSFGDKVGNGAGKAKVGSSVVLSELRSHRDTMELVEDGNAPPSALAIASSLLVSLLANQAEESIQLDSILHEHQIVTTVLTSLEKMAPHTRAKLVKSKGQSQTGDVFDLDLQHLLACVRLLRIFLKSAVGMQVMAKAGTSELAAVLCDVVLLSELKDSVDWSEAECEDVKMAVLQFAFSISAISPDWSRAFANSPFNVYTVLRTCRYAFSESPPTPQRADEQEMEVDEEHETRSPAADAREVICLALGLLKYMLDAASSPSKALDIDVCNDSTSAQLCISRCECGNALRGVNVLVQLYQRELSDKDDNAEAGFLAGYLAIILTRLLQEPSESEPILSSLSDDRQTALNGLVDCLNDFHSIYDRVQTVMLRPIRDPAHEEGSADVDGMAMANGGEDDVVAEQAASALVFLKGLRDGE